MRVRTCFIVQCRNIPLIADANGQFRNRITMRIPLVRYVSPHWRRQKFFQEYGRRSEEAHLTVRYGEGGGFCVVFPPQTGLIGVHNPRACSDGSIFRLWHRKADKKGFCEPVHCNITLRVCLQLSCLPHCNSRAYQRR